MKIAVYYDTLVSKGGAERVAILIANSLGADIITAGYNKKVNSWIPIKNNVINLGNSTLDMSKPLGTLFEAPLRFYLNRNRFIENYDVHIFLGFSSIYGANARNKNIWYCLTPNRMLYDLKDLKLGNLNPLASFVFFIYINLFRYFDPKVVKNNFKKIIAQTVTIKERVKKYYKLTAPVIYPSFDPKGFRFESFGDYFLSVSRLNEEKRVALIARSFTEMPNKKLLIVGDGPEREKIKEIIAGHANITYKQSCSDAELHELYAHCLATIYMPIDEDYGLIPLESMAAGKACIGANEGGLRETIIHNKTGFLIKADKSSIKKTVLSFTKTKAQSMKNDCIKQSQNFDLKTFIKKWKEAINEL
jgi:glycosyltransferase involved in cell wall biosynthesis